MNDSDPMSRTGQATSASIRMGHMSVSASGDQLRTLLGSCVGVALFDRRCQLGGLAHIVLPRANGTTDHPGKFVDTAIPVLIEALTRISGTNFKLNLVAKLAGGASMFNTNVANNIGRQNVEAAEQLLRKCGIPIVSKHCGGEQGRKMTLATDTGRVTIEIVGHVAVEI